MDSSSPYLVDVLVVYELWDKKFTTHRECRGTVMCVAAQRGKRTLN